VSFLSFVFDPFRGMYLPSFVVVTFMKDRFFGDCILVEGAVIFSSCNDPCSVLKDVNKLYD
jgi:hypothetical protein